MFCISPFLAPLFAPPTPEINVCYTLDISKKLLFSQVILILQALIFLNNLTDINWEYSGVNRIICTFVLGDSSSLCSSQQRESHRLFLALSVSYIWYINRKQ